jgi:hypothetical protein
MAEENGTSNTQQQKEPTPQEKTMMDMGLMDKPEVVENPDEKVEQKKETTEVKIPEKKVETSTTDWAKITGGKINSDAELEEALTAREKIKEYEPYKEKYSQLEAEHAKLKTTNPFAGNEPLYKVSKLAEELGRNDYGFLFNIVQSDFKSMPALEVLKTKELLDNPEIYSGKEYLLDKGLLEQYNIEKPEDYDQLEPDEQKRIDDKVALNTIKMEKAAKMARTYLSELQEKHKPEVVDTEKVQQEQKAKLENFVTQWKPTYQSVEKEFTKISIDVDGADFEIPIREEDAALKKQVFEEAAGYLVAQGLELNDKNIEHLKDVIIDRYISLNKKFVFKKIGEIAREMTDEQWRKRIHNPSAIKTDIKVAETEMTPEQKAIKALQG